MDIPVTYVGNLEKYNKRTKLLNINFKEFKKHISDLKEYKMDDKNKTDKTDLNKSIDSKTSARQNKTKSKTNRRRKSRKSRKRKDPLIIKKKEKIKDASKDSGIYATKMKHFHAAAGTSHLLRKQSGIFERSIEEIQKSQNMTEQKNNNLKETDKTNDFLKEKEKTKNSPKETKKTNDTVQKAGFSSTTHYLSSTRKLKSQDVAFAKLQKKLKFTAEQYENSKSSKPNHFSVARSRNQVIRKHFRRINAGKLYLYRKQLEYTEEKWKKLAPEKHELQRMIDHVLFPSGSKKHQLHKKKKSIRDDHKNQNLELEKIRKIYKEITDWVKEKQ